MAHSIGKMITKLRKENGWTQVELAEKLNYSDKNISKWEQDNGEPNSEAFLKLAKLFDVSIDYLMTGKETELNINVFHEGIVCVDELLAINDFKVIKKTLLDNPIHVIEILYKMFQEKEWRALFHYAVDNNNNELSRALMNYDLKAIENALLSIWERGEKKNVLNREHLYIIENDRKRDVFVTYDWKSDYVETLEKVIAKLQRCKRQIIDKISLK